MRIKDLLKNRILDPIRERQARRYQQKMETYAKNNPEKCCRYFFKKKTGKRLNLKTPQTLSEKIQWLKLYEILPRLPLYTQCADKYLARDFVIGRGYADILVPLIGVYDSPDQIDFSALPDRFVLKANHSSGQNLIVKDKSELNWDETKKMLSSWLATEYWLKGGEWQYRNIPPKILCEKFLSSKGSELVDYKFFCYNGEVEYLDVWVDHGIGPRPLYIYLDKNMQPVPFNKDTIEFQKAGRQILLPDNLDRMMKVAKDLSKGFPFVRVDLYSTDGKIYFGELTFTPCAGVDPNYTPIGLKKLGEGIKIKNEF